jgi:DNA modification methylase
MGELTTRHRIVLGDARALRDVADASVHLVVTSPPYPMIGMWDGVFSELSPAAAAALAAGDGRAAFDHMHAELDRVWTECRRVLVPGGFACVNVGDATRTLAGEFRLFPNHARVVQGMERAGMTTLPDVLWRKPTNAPNKFMGSGMLPAGAYVTYEHEYVLIFRNGGKRPFDSEAAAAARRRSAYFWEERNVWFSDVWSDLPGARQETPDPAARDRSAAFPFEIPFRLVQMFSIAGDVVLDPFAGVGTTLAAALGSGRSSAGVERDASLLPAIEATLLGAAGLANRRTRDRLAAHRAFVEARRLAGRPPGHVNRAYGFPVVTQQETDLELTSVTAVRRERPGVVVATHAAARDLGEPVQGALFGS